MVKREAFENGILTVRFAGPKLKEHGVAIYDLAQTLIAVQRIVHKGYLATEERLEKGAFPRKEERPALALQLGERRRESDAFALVPILADPLTRQALKQIADYVASGVVGYYVGDVLKRVKNEKDAEKQIFIGAIYSEVVNIANRVDASGGVESISIGAPSIGKETIAAFTPETKDYLATLKGEIYLGRRQTIKGKVYKLYPNTRIVAIRRPGGKKVSVFLDDENFDAIRYRSDNKTMVEFAGHPRYRMGIETKTIDEFDADKVSLLDE
jgi:hypothetical protein